MARKTTRWLLEADRQTLAPLTVALGASAAFSPEHAEGFRVVTLAEPWSAAALLDTGFVRALIPVDWEGAEEQARAALVALRERFAPTSYRIVTLRRHGRFSAGRLGQWLAALPWPAGAPEDPAELVLAVGSPQLFAGVMARSDAKGLAPASEAPVDALSRAGAKLTEAFGCLAALGIDASGHEHWLELGAFPGGMTRELSRRGHRVTAVDVCAPSQAMRSLPGVTCLMSAVAEHVQTEAVDGLLCDVNGPPMAAALAVVKHSRALRPGGLVVHTLKLPTWSAATDLVGRVRASFQAAGLIPLAVHHLRQNRQELTVLARKG